MSWVATTVAGLSSKASNARWKRTRKLVALFLVGKQDEIQAALETSQLRDERVQIVHASEVMTMEDKPTAALRKKKDSSMARAIELVGEGKADAVISLGNTGGILAPGHLEVAPLARRGTRRNCDGHPRARQ